MATTTALLSAMTDVAQRQVEALNKWKAAAIMVRNIEEESYDLCFKSHYSTRDWIALNDQIEQRLKKAQTEERILRNKLLDALS